MTKILIMKKTISLLKAAAAYAVFAALPAVMASCDDDDDADCGNGGATAALTVSVAEGDAKVALDEGAEVEILAVADGAVKARAVVTAAAGGTLTGAEAVTAAMGDGVQLAAYAPAGLWTADTYGQAADFSVPADQSTAAAHEAADLMMAAPTAVADGRADLVMSHMMAKVSVHITDVTGNYDLSGASMAMPGRLTTVTADIAAGTAVTVEGATADINPYMPDNTPYRATASAVVAPGRAEGGKTLVSVSVGGETFAYDLPEDADWQAGKEYVYSMRLTYEGLVPYGSYVTDWGADDENLSGEAEEIFVYGVGDYLLADGSFLKADRLTAGRAADVVAVVFSTDVSAADAAAGYNAYAMGVECVTGKKYGFADLVGESVSDYAVALADLDGRTKTAMMIASEGYQAVDDKASTVFGSLDGYAQRHPLPSDVAAGWFVPAFGQMAQILNNLGRAGLTAETEVEMSNNSPIYKSDDEEVFARINAPIEALGLDGTFPADGAAIYVTTTEYATSTFNNFWCLQTLTDGGAWNWGFGRNPQRGSSSGRSLLPCTAVKLPAAY